MTTKQMVQILVEPHAELPDGITLRYKAESPLRTVKRVHFEPDDGPQGVWLVEGLDERGQRHPAHAVQVEDSGAGTSWLIWGDAHGLRLRLGDQEVAETHLLLGLEELVE